jgi:hypothetical protein
MVLEYACDVILAKSFRNCFAFILREGNAGMVIIDADTAVKVARI